MVGIAAVLVGLAGIGAAGPAEAKAQTLRFTSVEQSQGNAQTKTMFVSHGRDYIGGRLVGHETLECKIMGKLPARCRVTFVRRSVGTLYLRFRYTPWASRGHGVVTGGTRGYAGAHGTFTFRNLNKRGTRTAVAIRLA